MLKALYGMLQSSILYYKKVRKDIEIGFAKFRFVTFLTASSRLCWKMLLILSALVVSRSCALAWFVD
jgi:hypothetical protein